MIGTFLVILLAGIISLACATFIGKFIKHGDN